MRVSLAPHVTTPSNRRWPPSVTGTQENTHGCHVQHNHAPTVSPRQPPTRQVGPRGPTCFAAVRWCHTIGSTWRHTPTALISCGPHWPPSGTWFAKGNVVRPTATIACACPCLVRAEGHARVANRQALCPATPSRPRVFHVPNASGHVPRASLLASLLQPLLGTRVRCPDGKPLLPCPPRWLAA